MQSSLTVTPRTHWMNGWFLRMFARPVVRVDGADHAAQWSRPLTRAVAPGVHRVGAGARYRGFSSVLGVEEASVEVREGEQRLFEARNGFFNHEPFTVTER